MTLSVKCVKHSDKLTYKDIFTGIGHLRSKHKAALEWILGAFIREAAGIHEDVERYIHKVMEKKRYR